MVIRDQLEEYLSYQKYLVGKNESWLREPRGLNFSFVKAPVSSINEGEDLITKGGRVVQTSKHLVYDAKVQIIAPVWRDEFLYQALSKMPYDLRFILSGPVIWKDEPYTSGVLRCLCIVESGQQAHLSQYLKGSGLRSLDILVKSGATLRHDVCMSKGDYDYINVYVESFGTYEQVYAVSGMSRRSVRVLLMGDGAKSVLRGCIGIAANQVSKEYVSIEHYAPNTESEHCVKTVSHGKVDVSSKVYVHKTAWGSKSKQDIQHLLLSEKAKAFSKPALEITTDDVQCEHGAVTSLVDETLLFYMLSRGLSDSEAKALYIDGYIKSVYQEYGSIKSDMMDCIQPVL